ncbi:hypothetical protein F4677DRAFT_459050 [Hypoxylon crocopeplum]|nr:hypothetical protein F4677DRAFT_459050 [Hypoxylon crocopeplum]
MVVANWILAGGLVAGIAALIAIFPSMIFGSHLAFLIFLCQALFGPVLKAIAVAYALDDLRRRRCVGKASFIVALVVLYNLFILFGFLSESRIGGFIRYVARGKSDVVQREEIEKFFRKTWQEGVSIMPTIIKLYQYAWKETNKSGFFFRFIVPADILLGLWDWAFYIYQDYEITFKDLGRGGSPPTFEGWATGRIQAWFANVDVMIPPRFSPPAGLYRGRLNSLLPHREGERPLILGVTPPQQVNPRAPPNMQLQLEQLLRDISIEANDQNIHLVPDAQPGHPEPEGPRFEVRLSFLERGLISLRRVLNNPAEDNGGPKDVKGSFNGRDEFGGEISHLHLDGTARVVLHPEDVRVVIEAGWGERHPLATEAWYWKLWFHKYLRIRRPVPTGLVILYAPRHQGEFDVIREIIEAAVWNEAEGNLFRLDRDTFPIPPKPQERQCTREQPLGEEAGHSDLESILDDSVDYTEANKMSIL